MWRIDATGHVSEISDQDLRRILDLHQEWVISDGKTGECANLEGVDLAGAQLGGACLCRARLRGANLREAVFHGEGPNPSANMDAADLRETDLTNAKLDGANLTVGQLAGAIVTSAILPRNLDFREPLSVVQEASKNCRTLFLGMLAACLYTFIVVAQTTDAQLVIGGGTFKLPAIGTDVDVVGFYYVSPFILLATYIYFHIYLQRLWDRIAELPAQLLDGRRLDQAVYPWLLAGLVTTYFTRLRDKTPTLTWMQWLMSLLAGWMLVPVTLFYLWGRTVARHDLALSTLSIAVLAVGVFFAHFFYMTMRRTLMLLKPGECKSLGFPQFLFERTLTVNLTRVVLVASTLGICGWLSGWPRSRATRAPYSNSTNILLDAEAERRSNIVQTFFGYHPFTVGIQAREKQFSGASLQGLDLRLADLSGTRFDGSDLSGCWLHGANLSNASLSKTNLSGAQLASANLSMANLVDADLSRANLEGVDLTGAVLTWARLTDADLRDAKGLTREQLESACGERSVLTTVSGMDESRYWHALRRCPIQAEQERRTRAKEDTALRLKKEAEEAKTRAEKERLEREAQAATEAAAEAGRARAERDRLDKQVRPPTAEPRPLEEVAKPRIHLVATDETYLDRVVYKVRVSISIYQAH